MNFTRNTFAGFVLLSLAACGEAPETAAPTAATAPAASAGSAAQSEPVAPERLAALARSVEAAEAVRSVKRLQWAYGHYSELGLWHDFADLFADTGVGHYVQGDLDREGIRKLFVEQVGQGQLGLADGRIYPHISFSPVVTLDADGEHAHARFRILAMLGGYGGNATWFHGLYENAYVKERGVWKVNELSNTAQVTGNFTAGLKASAVPLDGPAFPFHYTLEQVGSIPVAPLAATDTLASLQQRAERVADEAAITNLQHLYGYYLDNHDWTPLVELFAAQGTFETGQQGVYFGKTSIRNALAQFAPLGDVDVDEHILFQTYVSIAPDGQSAAARVDQLGIQSKPAEHAEWTQGIYENTFIKEGGQWRIQSLHYYPRLITDYSKGWAADAQPAPGPSTAYPPDAPPTETYEIYPKFYLPAFHFSHPVTGRAPQYPEGSPANAGRPDFTSLGPLNVAYTALAVDEVEALARQALARDAVENLVNAYAYYVDECLPEQAAALFVDGAPGARALAEFFCPQGRQEGVMAVHHAVQPVIEVSPDGRSATVISKLWQVSTIPGGDTYQGSRLQGRAVLDGEVWKLAELVPDQQWSANGQGGRPFGQ